MSPNDLVVGDILLKRYFGGFVHWAIRNFTRNEGGSSSFVHAALYLGGGEIAEASGPGYRINPLMGRGKNFTYFAFRHRDANLADLAAHVLATWVRMRPTSADHVPGYAGGKGFGQYALGPAMAGAVKNWTDRNVAPAADAGAALWGKNGTPGVQSSFCSQLVVEAYTAAGATYTPPVVPIPVAANRATPAMLQDVLLRNGQWSFAGSFQST